MRKEKLVEVSQLVILEVLEDVCGKELAEKALIALNKGGVKFCRVEKAPLHPYLMLSKIDKTPF